MVVLVVLNCSHLLLFGDPVFERPAGGVQGVGHTLGPLLLDSLIVGKHGGQLLGALEVKASVRAQGDLERGNHRATK